MNSRPLTPFLVSFAIATAVGFGPLARAAGQPDPSAVLSSPAGEYTSEQLLASLSRQLGDHFRAEGELQLELLRPWTAGAAAFITPLDAVVAEFPATLSSSMIIRLRLQSGERILSEQTLVVRAQLLREAWVARTPLEREATFSASELDTRRVDVLRERDVVPVSEGSSELTFVRSIPAGRVLTWRDVARRALVRKGQVIEVAAVDGPLSITMKALAMENGAAGEMVKVRNLESRKEFNALVVADARAQVRF